MKKRKKTKDAVLISKSFENGIVVKMRWHGKKRAGNESAIFARFRIYQMQAFQEEVLISTGMSCPSDSWDGNVFIGKGDSAIIMNKRLRGFATTIESGLSELASSTIDNIDDLLKEIENGLKPKITNRKSKSQKHSFSILAKQKMEDLIAEYTKENQFSESYKKTLNDSVKCLNIFWLKKLQTNTPTCNKIKKADTNKFCSWMENEKGYKHNTQVTYLNRLRTLFLFAVEKRIIANSPITSGVSDYVDMEKMVVLDHEEINKIYQLDDKKLSDSERRAKYLFIFLCHVGTGYGELKTIRLNHFNSHTDGSIYIKKIRQKLRHLKKKPKPYITTLSPIAKKIFLDYLCPNYGTKQAKEPFEGLPTIEAISRQFKKIVAKAGIEKSVSTYSTRHSFAVNWVTSGENINILKDMMGHISRERTDTYAKVGENNIISQSQRAYEKQNEVYKIR